MVAANERPLRKIVDIVFLDLGFGYPHVCAQARTVKGAKALQTSKAVNLPRLDMYAIWDICLALDIRVLRLKDVRDENTFR